MLLTPFIQSLFLASTFSIPVCTETASIQNNQRLECRIPISETQTKTFYVLKLRGSFPQTTYAHGFLMGKHSADGLHHEVMERMDRELGHGSLAAQQLKKSIFACYFSRMKDSVSSEFQDAMNSFYDGVQKVAEVDRWNVPYSKTDFEKATLGVELSIATEGLSRRIEEDPIQTLAEVAAVCGIEATTETLGTLIELVTGMGNFMKMGCLGFVSPINEGGMIHGRNLDANLVEAWNKAPTVFLVEEPGYFKYVAAASAGMMYPGGISGMNEKGIAVSLHEMSTTKYKTYISHRQGVMAPYLQQRILREADTLDAAIALIRNSKHFGSWTFLVSDSKDNSSASIEISGDRVEVARRAKDNPMAQSNHFLGMKMQDQFFTYNFNKTLESQSRLEWTFEEIVRDQGKIDIEWAINHLAGHQDRWEGFRSFGRTTTKAYTVMSTIARPALNEFWVTAGDRRPASHSHFVGFKVNWNAFDIQPIDVKRVQLYNGLPNWEQSLALYSQSRVLFEKENYDASLLMLSEAIRLARKDGIIEYPYYYMRARVLRHVNRFEAAARDFELVWTHHGKLHPYQQALVALYSVENASHLSSRSNFTLTGKQESARLAHAENVLKDLHKRYDHFDLGRKSNVLDALKGGLFAKKLKMPAIDFVTVE